MGNILNLKNMEMMMKTTREQCIEAIDYFFTEGFIDELGTDKRYYTKILLNRVAKHYGIKLQWEDTDE